VVPPCRAGRRDRRRRTARPDVASHLFVGDESGLPAFGELLAGLPSGARATVVVEVASAAEQQPLPSPAEVDVRWVHRNGQPAGRPELLAGALRAIEAVDGPAQAYVLGESRAVVALHPVLAELGIGRARTFVKGYWNRPRGQ
jgi:NADPH-dependent ferric siderophore reductase